MSSILEALNVVQFGRRYLLDALASIPEEALDFRPPLQTESGPPPFSLREQFLHIADIGEMFVFEGVLGSKMPESRYRLQTNADGSRSLREPWASPYSLRAELESAWSFQDEHIFGRSLEHLAARVGKEGRSLLADEIGWLLFHESQHRGQVLLLMRLAGLQPPAW